MSKLACFGVIASLTIIAFALCLPSSAFAWNDPCGIKSSPIDCQNYLKGVEYSRERAVAAGKAKAELTASIKKAREQFWATYPNKPGAVKAREEFTKWLFYKDHYYLRLMLIGTQDKDLTSRRGPDFIAHILDLSVGPQTVDGGIRQSAKPEFAAWVEAIRTKIFEGHTSSSMDNAFIRGFESAFMSEKFWKALAASEKEYQAYIIERDWWEFDDVKRIPAGFEEPENYGALLYSRWDDLKMPVAQETYHTMEQLLGPSIVHAAAKRVLEAPKTARGGLVVTVPPPVKTGPGGSQLPDYDVPMPETVIGTYGDPVKAMEILATQGDDRRYLLYLLTDENPPKHGLMDRATQWTFADTAYKRLVLAFGEQDVLQAAHLVRVARKRMTSNTVMDQKAIGATRNKPFEAFADILARKNPRGYVRSILIFSGNLDSSAAVDTAYQKLVSEHGEKEVMAAARTMAAGKPYPILNSELENLKSELNSAAREDEEADAEEVDDPDYMAWKEFAPGAKATYASRGLSQVNPGSDQFSPGQVSGRKTYLLQSVDDHQARLWFTEVAYDYPSGRAHPPRDTEIAYPAKMSEQENTPPTASGKETLNIAGRSLATRWETIQRPGYGCDRTVIVTTWTSDEVPGGLVRRTEDNNCPTARLIRETILESFKGVRQPGVTNAMAAPPPPPPSASPPIPATPVVGKRGLPSPPTIPSARAATPAAVVNPSLEKPYPPDPEFPNYYLTEKAADKSIASYCQKIYEPAFPLLSQEQVTFVHKNRAAVAADVKTCISWFDAKQMMADRKIALRYCLVNNDFTAIGQARRKIDYDACMNQNDVITALCTQEAQVRQELNSKKGFRGVSGMCHAPVPFGREALVVKQGGREDFGSTFVIPATGPGLPAILRSPLPPGIVRSGTPAFSSPSSDKLGGHP